jgi:hypothetical protein
MQYNTKQICVLKSNKDNKESPPVHPIPEASLGVLRTDFHALRAGRRFEDKRQDKEQSRPKGRGIEPNGIK